MAALTCANAIRTPVSAGLIVIRRRSATSWTRANATISAGASSPAAYGPCWRTAAPLWPSQPARLSCLPACGSSSPSLDSFRDAHLVGHLGASLFLLHGAQSLGLLLRDADVLTGLDLDLHQWSASRAV